MRITDICTTLDETLTIVAPYYVCRYDYACLRRDNQCWRVYSNLLINGKSLRAQRYGLTQGLVDFGKGRSWPMTNCSKKYWNWYPRTPFVAGCVTDVEHARRFERGTSG